MNVSGESVNNAACEGMNTFICLVLRFSGSGPAASLFLLSIRLALF